MNYMIIIWNSSEEQRSRRSCFRSPDLTRSRFTRLRMKPTFRHGKSNSKDSVTGISHISGSFRGDPASTSFHINNFVVSGM